MAGKFKRLVRRVKDVGKEAGNSFREKMRLFKKKKNKSNNHDMDDMHGKMHGKDKDMDDMHKKMGKKKKGK